MSGASYTPTLEDLTNVIKLLHDNGIDVSNSKAAYQSLKAYERNPQFCILLSTVYGAEECPVSGLSLSVPWARYRQLAAITLKNNVSVAKHALGQEAVTQVARCALGTLCNPPDERIARASAQIVVKVTEITSFDWWASVGQGDLADILLNKLLSSGGIKTLAALYALQFLMEDMPKQVGQASEDIVARVALLAVSPQVPLDLRKASFRMCFSVYERSSLLDWNVDVLSPLQQGLVNASWSFATTCTALLQGSCESDTWFMTAVLRSCLFLLDYFDYFTALTQADQQQMNQAWVTNAMSIIFQNAESSRSDELVAAAIDLIAGILQSHDSGNGEGASAFLAVPIAQNVPALIQALVKHSFMSSEEYGSIMESDDYKIREQVPVRFDSRKSNKDLAKDDLLDEDEAAMSLRRSALRCVDQLCTFAGGAAYNALIPQIEPLWGSSDWRAREVGIILLGTMATGCSMYMGAILEGIITQLVTFAGNKDENVCVSSIAFWTLSRLAEDMLVSVPKCFDSYLDAIIARMPSTSKRVQHASVTAMNGALSAAYSYNAGDRLQSRFHNLLNAIAASFPMYSTVSLSLLVDLTYQLMTSLQAMNASSLITEIGALLKQERQSKAQSFEQSYTSTYIDNSPNSFVDTDVFSLDRAIIGVLSFQPNDAVAEANLSVWNMVLQDLIKRDLVEETNLVLGVVTTCYGYFTSITSNAQTQWNQSTSGSLPQAVMQVLSTAKSSHVKVAAVTLLEALVKSLGAAAVPEATYDPIMGFLAEQIANEDDAELKHDCVQLTITLTLQNTTKAGAASTTAAIAAVNAALRNDVYGDTLYYFTGIAFNVCRLAASKPSLAGSLNLDVVSSLLARAENDFRKSEATIHWGAALTRASANVLDNLVSRSLVVAFSWQQAAHQFPGTAEAIAGVLHRMYSECQTTFQSLLSAYPSPAQELIQSLYFQ